MRRLEGKTALITGAASGLGLEDARLFAREGAQVVMTDVDMQKGAAAAEAIEGARFLKHDVSSEDDWKSVLADIEATEGGLDILVNNAGVVILSNPEDCTLEQFRFANSVMSEGVFLGVKYAMPLLKQGAGGSIINMSSVASHVGFPIFFAYTAAKGAVKMLTKAMCIELAPHNIQVNGIGPGYMKTELNKALLENPEFNAWVCGRTPAGRWGELDELKGAVVFLASDASTFDNGAILYVDGGLTSTM